MIEKTGIQKLDTINKMALLRKGNVPVPLIILLGPKEDTDRAMEKEEEILGNYYVETEPGYERNDPGKVYFAMECDYLNSGIPFPSIRHEMIDVTGISDSVWRKLIKELALEGLTEEALKTLGTDALSALNRAFDIIVSQVLYTHYETFDDNIFHDQELETIKKACIMETNRIKEKEHNRVDTAPTKPNAKSVPTNSEPSLTDILKTAVDDKENISKEEKKTSSMTNIMFPGGIKPVLENKTAPGGDNREKENGNTEKIPQASENPETPKTEPAVFPDTIIFDDAEKAQPAKDNADEKASPTAKLPPHIPPNARMRKLSTIIKNEGRERPISPERPSAPVSEEAAKKPAEVPVEPDSVPVEEELENENGEFIPKPTVSEKKTPKYLIKEELTEEEAKENEKLLSELKAMYTSVIQYTEETCNSRYRVIINKMKEAMDKNTYKFQFCPMYLEISDDTSSDLYRKLYDLDKATQSFQKKVIHQIKKIGCPFCSHEWVEDITFLEKGPHFIECPECMAEQGFEKT